MALTAAAGVDQALGYQLAKITLAVIDTGGIGRAGYLVRMFNGTGGTGAEWGNATSDASGNAVFYLVEGAYGYRVEKNGAVSGKMALTVAAGVDQTLSYQLGQVTIHVQDSKGTEQPGYLVRIYNGTGGTGSEWGNTTTNASGDAVFYLVEGGYQYKVEKGTYKSGRLPVSGFSVTQGATIKFIQTRT